MKGANVGNGCRCVCIGAAVAAADLLRPLPVEVTDKQADEGEGRPGKGSELEKMCGASYTGANVPSGLGTNGAQLELVEKR